MTDPGLRCRDDGTNETMQQGISADPHHVISASDNGLRVSMRLPAFPAIIYCGSPSDYQPRSSLRNSCISGDISAVWLSGTMPPSEPQLHDAENANETCSQLHSADRTM